MDKIGIETIRTVLADDHEVVRSGIRNALTSLEQLEIVGEVADGPELLAILADATPDLLLLDVTMPEFDPISQIQQIRTSYPAMKILVVSAYDDDVYVQGLLKVGVDGYHLKDQPLRDLRLAVQQVLAGEKWISGPLVNKLINYSMGDSALEGHGTINAKSHNANQSNLGTRSRSGSTVKLTARQSEIMGLLEEGLDNNTIARRMNLSIKTIENHLTRLYRQLSVQSRMEAVHFIRRNPHIVARPTQDSSAQVSTESIRHGPTLPMDGQITVLLVDDNRRYRHQLRRMVGKACDNAHVYEADSVQNAAELAAEITPALALVDVVLGDEDGIQCTRRIKAQSPTSRIVLITAYPDREFHRRGLEAGAVALLDKKVLDTPALRQVIEDSM